MNHIIEQQKERAGMPPQKLASIFHDTYEALAPAYGYETRKETRDFDPKSPNGKLMIAVCEFIIKTEIDTLITQTHQQTIAEVVRIAESLPNYNKSFGAVEGGLISKNALIEAITSNKE